MRNGSNHTHGTTSSSSSTGRNNTGSNEHRQTSGGMTSRTSERTDVNNYNNNKITNTNTNTTRVGTTAKGTTTSTSTSTSTTGSTGAAGSDGQYKIHFLSALASVPVPLPLMTGVPIYTVSANGKTQPATLTFSMDRFTAYIRHNADHHHHHQYHHAASSPSSGSNGPGGGLARAHSEKSLLGSSLFALGFTNNNNNNNNNSNSNSNAIDIGEMDRVQRGQSTQQFELAKKHAKVEDNKVLDVLYRKAELQRNSSTSSNSSLPSSSSSSTATANINKLDPSLSFSIIFRGAHTVDLMAQTEKDRNVICNTLDQILQAYRRSKNRVSTDILLLRYVWLDVDRNKTGYVTVQQFWQALQAINFNKKLKDVATDYEKFGRTIGLDKSYRKRGLTFEQSTTFLHKMKRDNFLVKPINVIWNDQFGETMNNNKMRTTVSDRTFLEKFMHGKQGHKTVTITDVRILFRHLHDMEFAHTVTEAIDLNRINKDMFEAYLLAAENEAFDPAKEVLREQDMDQPLSEYFINSSHNTYLIGDQYKSHSSVEMYSNALYRGARCLELDIWDGGRSQTGRPMPVVWHGGTLTTKVKFTDIIKTIKVFLNFHPDTYPIILSFENHCSIPFQEYIAEQLIILLGNSLYIPTESSLFGKLPSPNKLRGMVVIKGRRPDGTEADQYDSDDDSDTEEGVSIHTGDQSEVQAARANVVKHGVAPGLASLTLFHGHKCKSFEQSMRTPTYYMHSFSESKVRSKCRQKQSARWIEYNQTHMSRTYPAGSRVDSSNYNPLLAWSTGCQMAALNFQTQDANLRLNDGRFRENGNCGYVLKPASLMSKGDISKTPDGIVLAIRVLSGSCLPKPKGLRGGDCIDPYVKVSVYDVKNEERVIFTEFATSPVPSNGYFPIWNQETFKFSVDNWAVAMLNVTVYDKLKEEFIASSSIPISCLRRGIRCVKVYDATNTRSGAFDFASLLLDVKITKRVAEI